MVVVVGLFCKGCVCAGVGFWEGVPGARAYAPSGMHHAGLRGEGAKPVGLHRPLLPGLCVRAGAKLEPNWGQTGVEADLSGAQFP